MAGKRGLDFLKTVTAFWADSKGFDRLMKPLQILSAGDGAVKVEFKVEEEHLNRGGGLHGGFIATLVDNVTTMGLMTHKNEPAPGVSVDLHVSYLKGAKEGDDVIVEATTVRAGKNLAYIECELRHKKDNSVIAKGGQTKFIGLPK